MNIKSLLIGSAAALSTVTGAYAADAVVAAEPEPMEYVRVCDAYGAGFFYIPGTETCLSISGYVWYQVGPAANVVVGANGYAHFDITGFTKNVRARVNFDARSETEWGTLRSYIRLQSTWTGYNTFDGPVAVDQAWLSIGGLRMGYTESAWVNTTNGGASSWGSHSWSGMSYGYQQRDLVQYSFSGGNGVFATLSLEDDNNGNWVPDVVGVAGMSQGWGAVWAKIAYDESASGWAGSLGAQINVPNMAGSSLRVIGWYANNANNYAVWDGNFVSNAYRWSILASYNHQFNEKLGASLGFQYFGHAYTAAVGNPNGWDVELSVVYTPVTNLEIRAELGYGQRGLGTYAGGAGWRGLNKGYLRVTRYF